MPQNPDAFQVGDVVELNSGSRPMTVEAVEDEQVQCIYQDYKNAMIRVTFHARMIRRWPTEPNVSLDGNPRQSS